MNFSQFFITRPIFAGVLSVMLVLVGGISLFRLPVSEYPEVVPPPGVVSLTGTFAVMAAFGFSINALSLFGLVLASGIVVDDAIVVVENVERNIGHGLSPLEATKRAMQEVTGPIVAPGERAARASWRGNPAHFSVPESPSSRDATTNPRDACGTQRRYAAQLSKS